MSGRPRSPDSPLRADYAERLKQWRLKCGGPSFRDLAQAIDWPTSAIFDRLAGGRNLTWPFIRDFVSACHEYAGLKGEPDLSTWRRDFDQMLEEETQARRDGRALKPGRTAGKTQPALDVVDRMRTGGTAAKAEAVEALCELLGDCRRALGDDAPVTLDVAVDLAWWLAADGRAAEAAGG